MKIAVCVKRVPDMEQRFKIAVLDGGGVETNTANVIQVELVGTCDPNNRHTMTDWRGVRLRAEVDYIYWPDAPDWALRDLAAFLRDMHDRHGIKLQGPSTWAACTRRRRGGRPGCTWRCSPSAAATTWRRS